MDRINDTGNDLQRIQELFKELESAQAYSAWAGTFDIEVVSPKKVHIIYHGLHPVRAFKKACKETLFACIRSIMGGRVKIRVLKKRGYNALSAKTRKNIRAVRFFVAGLIFVCIAAASVVVLYNYVTNRQFRETFYITSSIKIDRPIRVIQLSDLHGASYGKDNVQLVTRIAALQPDLILCTGDMVDSIAEDGDRVVALGSALADIAPTYYVYGNNEVDEVYGFSFNEAELDKQFGFDAAGRDETVLPALADPFEEKLEQAGVRVLKNETASLTVHSMTIDVYGVLNSNPSSFWSYSGKAFSDYLYQNPNHIKITAVHEPFIFQEFEPEFWGDLMLCGHTHGGLIRVPVLGPLFTPEGGLFPARNNHFVYGRYDAAGTPLIVSGGLDNASVLRINNQPELVIIDINKF